MRLLTILLKRLGLATVVLVALGQAGTSTRPRLSNSSLVIGSFSITKYERGVGRRVGCFLLLGQARSVVVAAPAPSHPEKPRRFTMRRLPRMMRAFYEY